MKKIALLMMLVILAGFTLNCNPPVPQNAFRVKTRGKFHLFGIPLPFSIPNPNIALNLKTNLAPGAPGTTGSVNEYNPGGANIETDLGGKFDAVNAVLPAPWNAKVAPNQARCTTSNVPILSFNAVAGGVYKIRCKWNIQVDLLVEPGFVDLTQSGPPSLTGIMVNGGGGKPLFRNAQNIKIRYYRQDDGEDYELDGEKSPISGSPDGNSLLIPVPDYYSNYGLVHYRILIVEDGVNDVYLAHGEFDVVYPPEPCPPRHCPIGKHWDSDLCYCVED
jgi:hypothetical protein